MWKGYRTKNRSGLRIDYWFFRLYFLFLLFFPFYFCANFSLFIFFEFNVKQAISAAIPFLTPIDISWIDLCDWPTQKRPGGRGIRSIIDFQPYDLLWGGWWWLWLFERQIFQQRLFRSSQKTWTRMNFSGCLRRHWKSPTPLSLVWSIIDCSSVCR